MNDSTIADCAVRSIPMIPTRDETGFSLLELLIAMAVFLVAGAASFTLFSRHQRLYGEQQGLSALNISLRNAVAQMQLDLVNAGTGETVGTNVPSWPVGATIINASGINCYDSTAHTYAASCFDTLNILAADSAVPAVHPHDGTMNPVNTNTSSDIYIDPLAGQTAAQTAALFKTGDQLLLMKNAGWPYTTVVLTQDGDGSSGKVKLHHNITNADGTNTSANDPLGISTHSNEKLGADFDIDDWLIKLAPITYTVDASDPTNPKLIRIQKGVSTVVTEQIVGFKVGASLWNGGTTSSETYNYDASSFADPTVSPAEHYNYTLIRSIRISLIGRTLPNLDPSYTFRNSFDQGPYQIQASSIVVNPRNLSMRD